MHKCKMTDFFTLENGKITRIIKAIWKNKEITVYKENEDEEYFSRHLYFSQIAGYLVLFPDEKLNPYKYSINSISWIQEIEKEGWRKATKCNISCKESEFSEEEKKILISKYPDFKYVLQKWESNRENTLKALKFWKENKKIELLLASGMERIAFNRNFYKLSEKKKKEIIRFCVNSPEWNNYTLSEIQTIIKNKLDLDEFEEWILAKNQISKKLSYKLFKYLEQKNICDYEGYSLYNDYLKMLKEQNQHNLKDKYWLFPSDLRAAHNKVLKEIENERRLRELEEEEIQKHKLKYFYRQSKKYSVFDSVINGYSVYIPKTIQDVRIQAKALNQCLIRCDYVKQMAEKKKLLVFIKKNDERIATVEVLPEKKIGQFYGDELDKAKIYPSEEIRNIFNQWLKKAEIGQKL